MNHQEKRRIMMLPTRLFGFLGLPKGLNTPRLVSWLGRTVTTKAPDCDPKCPKIGLSSRCCRSQDNDDDDCLLTSPQNFWFPGNIFHPNKSHHSIETTYSHLDDVSDIGDSGSD